MKLNWYKHQKTNPKSQINSNIQSPKSQTVWCLKFGIWFLNVIWDLSFGAFNFYYKKLNISQINLDEIVVKGETGGE